MRYIETGGKRLPLKFTYNSLCRLEEETGRAFSGMLKTELSCVRGLLWCALLSARPKLTLADAGRLAEAYVREHSLAELGELLAGALADAGFTSPAARR